MSETTGWDDRSSVRDNRAPNLPRGGPLHLSDIQHLHLGLSSSVTNEIPLRAQDTPTLVIPRFAFATQDVLS